MPSSQKLGAGVFGISPDSVKSHAKFRDKHALGLTLLSDEQKAVIEAYGVWTQKKMYGREYMGVERSTFLIGPDGKIAACWRGVEVPGHAALGARCLEKAPMMKAPSKLVSLGILSHYCGLRETRPQMPSKIA